MTIRVHRILIHTYMLVSSLALILLIPMHNMAPALYTVGASSWLISIGLTSGGALAAPVGAVLWLWGCVFPVLLVIFYIMALKERYIPFCLLASVDSLIVLFWCFCCLIDNNKYALQWAGPDAIVSILFSVVLMISLWGTKKTRDGSGQGGGSVVP